MGKWRLYVIGTVVVVLSAFGVFVAVTHDQSRGSDELGCIKQEAAPFPPENTLDIDSFLVLENKTIDTLYVSRANRSLYSASSPDYRWKKASALTPGPLYAGSGKRDGFLLSAGGGLYRSDDEGDSWKSVTCRLIVTDVALSAKDPSTIYIGTDPGEGSSARQTGGLYYSRNNGRSWAHVTGSELSRRTPDVYSEVVKIGIDPIRLGRIYLSTGAGGLLENEGNLDHWRIVKIRNTNYGDVLVTSIAFTEGKKRTVWVTTERNGVFKQTSGSQSWISSGLRNTEATTILADNKAFKNLFVLANKTIYRTANGGASWTKIDAIHDGILGITKGHQGIYAWSQKHIYLSRNRGSGWEQINNLTD